MLAARITAIKIRSRWRFVYRFYLYLYLYLPGYLLLLLVFVFVFTWMSSNMKTTPTTWAAMRTISTETQYNVFRLIWEEMRVRVFCKILGLKTIIFWFIYFVIVFLFQFKLTVNLAGFVQNLNIDNTVFREYIDSMSWVKFQLCTWRNRIHFQNLGYFAYFAYFLSTSAKLVHLKMPNRIATMQLLKRQPM